MKKNIISILIFLLSFLYCREDIFASDASIWLKGDSAVTVGNEFDVTIEISSEEDLNEIETYLSYSDEIAKFISADDGIAGGKGLLRVNIRSFEDNSKKFTYKIRFLARKAGKFTISFSDTVHMYAKDTDDEISVASSDLEILVKNKRQASSDSSLSNLKIAGAELKPKFSKSILDYTAEVGPDVENIVVGVDLSDANSEYSLKKDYEDKLKTGNNKIEIIVKAEDGNTTTYTITVIKDDESVSEKGEAANSELKPEDDKNSEIKSKSEVTEEPEYVPNPSDDEAQTETNIKDSKQAVVYVIIGAAIILGIMLISVIIIYIKNKNKDELED
ncbi:MAG: cadherin-like beta sandwich domain-containing protein [Catonella sp.]|uniref:cadherin-like beta sandwich domain-containing protein n=1 Tax=Catonella sp. TaxID=2382125 RepID=UPI003F9F9DD2